MLGTPISGERAHAVGLVNRLADDETLLDEAGALATTLSNGSRQVAGAAKQLLLTTSHLPVHEGIVEERRVASDLFASQDGREGFAAFVARRPPVFEGAPRES
ncbi:enoyl-CoA hydratase-related protein [Aeromicrobium sp. UC242_57]|uniref:enoyl-CoA hydratase-related protein n=1 Tax=Aeromicrobium sp. UC242_57 TaxID=3374624 RepID=UPI0037A86477